MIIDYLCPLLWYLVFFVIFASQTLIIVFNIY